MYLSVLKSKTVFNIGKNIFVTENRMTRRRRQLTKSSEREGRS